VAGQITSGGIQGWVGRVRAWIKRTGVRTLEADVWRVRGERQSLAPDPSPMVGRAEQV